LDDVRDTSGVFDALADQAGRQARLNGRIAQALGANAPKLLQQAPSIERIEVLGAKFPGSNLLSQDFRLAQKECPLF